MLLLAIDAAKLNGKAVCYSRLLNPTPSVLKLLSLFTFLIMFDHLSYLKNENHYVFYYNLFYH
jgi:hypothetical protein